MYEFLRECSFAPSKYYAPNKNETTVFLCWLNKYQSTEQSTLTKKKIIDGPGETREMDKQYSSENLQKGLVSFGEREQRLNTISDWFELAKQPI